MNIFSGRNILLFCLSIISFKISAQTLQGECIKAGFGIDGYIYANGTSYSLPGGISDQNNADDWFYNPLIFDGDGINVIDTFNAAYLRNTLASGSNIYFSQEMSAPQNSIINGRRWMDATYVHDYFGGSGTIDQTSFVSASKNGEPLEDWNTGPHNVVPKNDLIDCYVHLRRDGVQAENPLWMYLGFSRISSSGNSYFDAELFVNNLVYNQLTGFEPVGTDEGHTAWQFDAFGNITKIGDMIVTVNMNTDNIPEFELRIWVKRFDFENLDPATFVFGNEFNGTSAGSQFGYGDILPPLGNDFGCGVTNQEAFLAPPWGSLDHLGNHSFYYEPGQFVEIGLNLYEFGIDPQLIAGFDACDFPYSNLLFKSRASSSFTAQLKDFSAPIYLAPLEDLNANILEDSLTCINRVITLQVENTITDAYYVWSTIDGNILTNLSSIYDTLIYVDQPGTYILGSAYMDDCELSYDTIVVKDYTQPPPANIGFDTVYNCGSVTTQLYALDDGYWYGWTGPGVNNYSDQSITVSQPGLYHLVVTNQYGCIASDSIYVLDYPCQTIDPPTIATNIILDTLPPFFTPPPDITVECFDDITDLGITGTVTDTQDNCDPNILSAVFDDEYITAGFCSGSGQLLRMWRLEDECGNIYSATQIIILSDNTPPNISSPPDVTISCQDDITDLNITGQAQILLDACDTLASNVTYIDIFENDFNCIGQTRIQRIWSAIDDCGNVAIDTQMIMMIDTLGPVILGITSTPFVNCDSVPNPPTISLYDNCDPNPSVVFNESIQAASCPNSYLLLRTWTATDDCGNETVVTQEINVEDGSNPTVLVFPEDITISCDALPIPFEPEVTDNCDTDVDIIFTEQVLLGSCEGNYTLTRRWEWVDDCNNSITSSQTITVIDTTAPGFTVPLDITLDCISDINNLSLSGDVLDEQDNCMTNIGEASFSDEAFFNCISSGIIERTWNLEDDCGNTTSYVQFITIIDTLPPVFNTPADITIACGVDINDLIITGDATNISDSCDSNSINTIYQDVVETNLSCSLESTIVRIWTSTDDCGNFSVDTQTINIIDTIPPFFEIPPDLTVDCHLDITDLTLVGEAINAMDNCDQSLGSITYIDTFFTDGFCSGTGFIERTWSLLDECGNLTANTQRIELIDTIPPLFTVPSDIELSCEEDPNDLTLTGDVIDEFDNCYTASLEAVYMDSVVLNYPCAGSSLILRTWVLEDECGNSNSQIQIISLEDTTPPVMFIPADVTLNCLVELQDTSMVGVPEIISENCGSNFGQISFIDSVYQNSSCDYLILRTWLGTDACGNIAADTQFIAIIDTIPPVFNTPADITIACGVDINDLIITGDATNISDNCDSTSINTVYQDVVEINPSCSLESTIFRIWTSTDDCGNFSVDTQTINIIDTIPPIFELPPDLTLDCHLDITDLTLVGEAINAMDNCDQSLGSITYIDTFFTNGFCSGTGFIERTWNLLDECGNLTANTQRIELIDTIPPLFTVPSDLELSCEENPNDLTLTGDVIDEFDNCYTASLEAVYMDSVVLNYPCAGSSLILRTWVLEDECGNSNSQIQIISMEDTTPPVMFIPADVTLNCLVELQDTSMVGVPEIISENCGSNFGQISFIDSVYQNSSCDYLILRTWLGTDACGNIAADTQFIAIIDTIPPTFNETPGTLIVSCDSIPPAQILTANDNCSVPVIVLFTEDTIPGACANNYTLNRTWIAADSCGNIASITQNLEVQDFGNPVLLEFPSDVTVACDSIPTVDSQNVEDNCDVDLIIDFVENIIPGSCYNNYEITRTWSWTDNCNNVSSHSQTITVIDNTPPVFSAPDDVTVDCSVDVDYLSFTGNITVATDNCDNAIANTMYSDSTFFSGICTGSFVIRRTWTLADSCGNSQSLVQYITVNDTLSPVFTIPPDITLSCGDNTENLNLTGDVNDEYDACDSSIGHAVYIDSIGVDSLCRATSVIYRTWRLYDDCGNGFSAVQIITLEDSQAPVFSNIPIDTVVFCSSIPAVINPTIIDSCGSSFTVQFYQENSLINCENDYTLQRKWVATDDCGNQDSLVQLIRIIDTIPPTLTNTPADVTLSCNDLMPAENLNFTDNCSDTVFVSFSESISEGTCIDIQIINRNWVATDKCGNETTINQQLTLINCGPDVGINLPPDNSSCENESINFEVSLTGTAFDSPVYQWQYTADTSQTWINLVGETSGNYNIPAVQFTHTGYYRVLVANNVNNITDSLCRVISQDVFLEILTLAQPTYLSSEICEGDSIIFGGQFLSSEGQYSDTLVAANGCDSIVYLTLLVNQNYKLTRSYNICAGESLDGNFYTLDTILMDTFTNIEGCDSIIFNEIFVHQPSIENILIQICTGEAYQGIYYYNDTTLIDSLQNYSGCDSILYTTINILEDISIHFDFNICEGDSLEIGDSIYKTEGNYTNILTASTGCDSIVDIQLSISPTYEFTRDVEICEGDEVFAEGTMQSNPGMYFDQYSTIYGCDSLWITNLIVKPDILTTVEYTFCQGTSFFVGGNLQTNSGTYTDIYQRTNGCDSIVASILTFYPAYNIQQDYTICDSDSMFMGGAFQTSSGIFMDSLTTRYGCDSIVTNILTISDDYVELIKEETICMGDSIFVNNQWMYSAGTYIETIGSTSGCDSILTTFLEVVNPNIVISEDAEICFGDEVQLFLEGADNLQEISWYPDYSLSCNDCPNPVAFPDVTTTYTVSYPSGCDGKILETQVTVIVKDPAEVEFTETEINIIEGDSVILMIADIDSNFIYTWQDANGNTICDTCSSIIVAPNSTTNYSVTAIEPGNGCPGLANVVTLVEKKLCEFGSLNVANVIFPQSGGYGDHLEIQFDQVEINIIRVYNRWGELIFETNDVADKWDGTFRGELLNPGVYVYYIQGTCPGKKKNKFMYSGNITLIH